MSRSLKLILAFVVMVLGCLYVQRTIVADYTIECQSRCDTTEQASLTDASLWECDGVAAELTSGNVPTNVANSRPGRLVTPQLAKPVRGNSVHGQHEVRGVLNSFSSIHNRGAMTVACHRLLASCNYCIVLRHLIC
ncbi:MAG: hypothetical protein KBT10_02225 [Bacteroidales bacterium]|nr:hypothetical protein [Candidatus Sodaliphilus aphodohippi]